MWRVAIRSGDETGRKLKGDGEADGKRGTGNRWENGGKSKGRERRRETKRDKRPRGRPRERSKGYLHRVVFFSVLFVRTVCRTAQPADLRDDEHELHSI